MVMRKQRSTDNGDETKYKRSLLGDTRDIIKLLVLSSAIGGGGTVGLNLLTGQATFGKTTETRTPPFTDAEKIIYVDKIDRHLDPRNPEHENADEKATRIREIYTREFLPIVQRLEDKIDNLSREIRHIKQRVNDNP